MVPLLAAALEAAAIEAPVTHALNRLIAGELPLDELGRAGARDRPAPGAVRQRRDVAALVVAAAHAAAPAGMTPAAVLFDLDGVLHRLARRDRALHRARPARERRRRCRRRRARAVHRAAADRRVRASSPGRSWPRRASRPTASATCGRACWRRPSSRARSPRSPTSPPACRSPSRRASRGVRRAAVRAPRPGRTCARWSGRSSTRRTRSSRSRCARALAALGLAPGADAPLVGDRSHDAEAARANGIAVRRRAVGHRRRGRAAGRGGRPDRGFARLTPGRFGARPRNPAG